MYALVLQLQQVLQLYLQGAKSAQNLEFGNSMH